MCFLIPQKQEIFILKMFRNSFWIIETVILVMYLVIIHFLVTITVSDRKGQDQPACQERWKKCKKKRRKEERRIVMPM
jgi:hypothetical protein